MFVAAFPASGCPDRIACVAFHADLLTQQLVFCFFKSCHFLDPLHTVLWCFILTLSCGDVAGVSGLSAQAKIISNRTTSITKPRILTPSQKTYSLIHPSFAASPRTSFRNRLCASTTSVILSASALARQSTRGSSRHSCSSVRASSITSSPRA